MDLQLTTGASAWRAWRLLSSLQACANWAHTKAVRLDEPSFQWRWIVIWTTALVSVVSVSSDGNVTHTTSENGFWKLHGYIAEMCFRAYPVGHRQPQLHGSYLVLGYLFVVACKGVLTFCVSSRPFVLDGGSSQRA